MKISIKSLVLGLSVGVLSFAGANAAYAGPREDKQFFDQVSGRWNGPGEIIAGKYKGTKFNCDLGGSSGVQKAGMTLDGVCRVGVFTEKITATVEMRGGGYKGAFLDGAKGKGLDVIGGGVVGPDKAVFSLNRSKLNGSMIARMKGDDTMVVTVSVRVEGKMIPVLGMNLKRTDSEVVGSIKAD